MANKRMINKTVVDSDAFLDMPQTTQNLYFHLNMRADDDGFLDSPKQVMRSVGSNQNDLEILLAKRYLLAFESGVIIIKHWKLHNTIRKDRYKPTLYQEELKTLVEKDNGSYTEAYNLLENNELDHWQPNDNQMTTNSTHRLGLDKVRLDIDKNNKKKINKKESGSLSNIIQSSIDHWNTKEKLPTCKYSVINLPDIRDVKIKFDVFSSIEINEAIDNLSEFWDMEEKKISSFHRFIIVSLDRWLESADPKSRYENENDNFKGEVNFDF